LLLLGFTAFQVRSYEDQLVDILLSACRGGLNTAHQQHKEYLFATRKERKKQSKKMADMAQSKHDLLKEVTAIIWQPKAIVIPQSVATVVQIRELLPLLQGQDEDQETLDLMQQQYVREEQIALLNCLEKVSLSLQQQASPIIKALHFNVKTSPPKLMAAIHHFKKKEGKISKAAPTDFLDDDQKDALLDENGRFRISLYKILLFQSIYRGIKSGRLNLKYSYRYKAYDEYLINAMNWKEQQNSLLEKAKLTKMKDFKTILNKLKPLLDEHFHHTNQRILKGENPHFILREDGKYMVKTPKVDTENRAKSLSIFPNEKIIPISEVLATIDDLTDYLAHFKHYQPYYRKQRPNKNVFFADIMAYGCNLGVEKMAKVARSVTATELENTANWYFDLENIQKATDTISNFMDKLELPNLFKKKKGELHTSSDGQKIPVASDTTIDAHYSFKYFGSGKGVTSYSFIDERFIPFYSTVINTTEREAIYVVDGLLHNETIRSTTHSTDTHGYTEAVFGLMDILGFGFAPRIAKLHRQQLYSFEKIADYKEHRYSVLPNGHINVELIEENWDAILRLVTSIKLKHCSASQIFKRLNSYSRQHPVYQALKEYGKIIKTIYILRYIDLLELRQAIQKQLNVVELSNRFSSAVSVGNGGEMVFLTHRDQLISDACKNLIKSAITCWNYLFMTRHIQKLKTMEEKEKLIKAIKSGTAIAWRHIYFNGLYDFSEEKLIDSFNLLTSQNYNLNLDG
jgi:TnpA family transposase